MGYSWYNHPLRRSDELPVRIQVSCQSDGKGGVLIPHTVSDGHMHAGLYKFYAVNATDGLFAHRWFDNGTPLGGALLVSFLASFQLMNLTPF